jgi:hypothetical protein
MGLLARAVHSIDDMRDKVWAQVNVGDEVFISYLGLCEVCFIADNGWGNEGRVITSKGDTERFVGSDARKIRTIPELAKEALSNKDNKDIMQLTNVFNKVLEELFIRLDEDYAYLNEHDITQFFSMLISRLTCSENMDDVEWHAAQLHKKLISIT